MKIVLDVASGTRKLIAQLNLALCQLYKLFHIAMKHNLIAPSRVKFVSSLTLSLYKPSTTLICVNFHRRNKLICSPFVQYSTGKLSILTKFVTCMSANQQHRHDSHVFIQCSTGARVKMATEVMCVSLRSTSVCHHRARIMPPVWISRLSTYASVNPRTVESIARRVSIYLVYHCTHARTFPLANNTHGFTFHSELFHVRKK